MSGWSRVLRRFASVFRFDLFNRLQRRLAREIKRPDERILCATKTRPRVFDIITWSLLVCLIRIPRARPGQTTAASTRNFNHKLRRAECFLFSPSPALLHTLSSVARPKKTFPCSSCQACQDAAPLARRLAPAACWDFVNGACSFRVFYFSSSSSQWMANAHSRDSGGACECVN